MYNLIEYSFVYLKTLGNLWKHYRDEPVLHDDVIVDFTGNNTSHLFNFKQKETGQTGDDGTKDLEIMVLLVYLRTLKCWTLEMLLINCEINPILTWSANCAISSTTAANQTATFTINDTKLYVPVVTLSNADNSKLLQQLKSGFILTINWNKFQSKVTTQTWNQSLDYLIDPGFQRVNRPFVLSFENTASRTIHTKCFLLTVEVKNNNVMINGRNLSDWPVKNDIRTYENNEKIL